MSYHVHASGSDGAISVPALTLEQARTKADELKRSGYANISIVDTGTGVPVRDDAVPRG